MLMPNVTVKSNFGMVAGTGEKFSGVCGPGVVGLDATCSSPFLGMAKGL